LIYLLLNIKAKTNDKNKATDIPADVKLNIPKASPNGPKVVPAGHVTSIFVVVGALLDVAGIYDRIVLYAGAGALIPIERHKHKSSFYYLQANTVCYRRY